MPHCCKKVLSFAKLYLLDNLLSSMFASLVERIYYLEEASPNSIVLFNHGTLSHLLST